MDEGLTHWHSSCLKVVVKLTHKAVLTVMAASMLMAATVVKANSVVLTQGIYSYDVGGEFTAVTSPDSFLGYYNPLAENKTATGFQTFCLETEVDFYPGANYTYTTASSTAPDNGVAGSGLALAKGTAFLYYEFATGVLAGYNYTDTAGRLSDAELLQAAIWYLQGGQTYGGYTAPSTGNNPFYALALNTFGSAATSAYTGSSVEVLQLWDGTTSAQNQLVLNGNVVPGFQIPVPDGGVTAGFLGMGLVGMFVIHCWRRKSI